MKTWAFRHPNVSFLAVLVFHLFIVWGFVDAIHDGRWGWAAGGLVASLYLCRWVAFWWRRT